MNTTHEVLEMEVGQVAAIADDDVATYYYNFSASDLSISGSSEPCFTFSHNDKKFVLLYGQMSPLLVRVL